MKTDGSRKLPQSQATFQSLLGLADKYLGKRKLAHAVVVGQIAALFASYNHPGEFVSPKLEGILRAIGNEVIKGPLDKADYVRGNGPVKRVLHVLTACKEVGGDSRFVWRWIMADAKRSHSVALTNQLYFGVPKLLSDAVRQTGGSVHILDADGGDAIRRAIKLREAACEADVVFIHVYTEDVVPMIAFGNPENLPVIVFVLQADHQFWVGVSVCDLFVHLRQSGAHLSEKRRGIPKDRCVFLPIPLEGGVSVARRAQARDKLGIPRDCVLLLSIARAIKYSPIREPGFVNAIVPVVQRYPKVRLLVIGPDNVGQWKAGHEETGGRILALGQRADTKDFYAAADIYLDSFPFASNTSLLEAGRHGLPLVSYFAYSREADVLGAGAPGLDCSLLRVGNIADYQTTVGRLIEDERYRVRLGEKTKRDIEQKHCGHGWNEHLQKLYEKIALTLGGPLELGRVAAEPAGELDSLLNQYYSRHVKLGWVINWCVRELPYRLRFGILVEMLRIERSFSFSLFLPKWLAGKLSHYMQGWRRFPGVEKWLVIKR